MPDEARASGNEDHDPPSAAGDGRLCAMALAGPSRWCSFFRMPRRLMEVPCNPCADKWRKWTSARVRFSFPIEPSWLLMIL
jgi:hypothetical protein